MNTNTDSVPSAPNRSTHSDVIVIGGGLAGLTAAVTAARAGASVRLLDARSTLGGRARTDHKHGYSANYGAHALYLHGVGAPILRDLGVAWSGKAPAFVGAKWWKDNHLVPSSRLSAIGGPASASALVRAISKRNIERVRGTDLESWIESQRPVSRDLIRFALRTTTYTADWSGVDAGAALEQLRCGLRGVLYLDGGWATLVAGLERRAHDAGVDIISSKAGGLHRSEAGWTLTASNGTDYSAPAIIIAVGGAGDADRVLNGASATVASWAAAARPVHAFCLDVMLGNQAKPGTSIYGLDEPMYLPNTSRSAKVAPANGRLIQGVVYEPDAWDADPRSKLEGMLDQSVPTWRTDLVDVIERRRMVVSHDRPRLHGPIATHTIDDLNGVWFASDAVHHFGWLADAAIGSGSASGEAAAEYVQAMGSTPVRSTTVHR